MTAYATPAQLATYLGATSPIGTTATATATVVGDAVSTVTLVTGGGDGYGYPPAVTISAPTAGTRATATATVAGGVVSALTLVGGGTGYTGLSPTVTIGPPTDTERLLLRASELIDDYIRTAIYDVDTDGEPTDADDIAALRDATCAQVEFWRDSDEEDDILGPVQGLILGPMQVQFGAGATRTAPLYLAPRAARILRKAGLYNSAPVLS